MNKCSSSRLLLKKLIQQNSIPSNIDSNPSIESCKRFPSPLYLNDPIRVPLQELSSYKRAETFEQELKIESRVKHELKLQSRMDPERRFGSIISNKDPESKVYPEIQCLKIQSRMLPVNLSVDQLPLESLQSKLLSQKLKVHSSIDGLDASKQSRPSLKENSMPISDLIITDNKYMKRSSCLNQHDTFSLAEEEELLTAKLYDNLKLLKRQTLERIELVEKQLELLEKDELVAKLNAQMQRVDLAIQAMRSCEYMCSGTPVSTNSVNPSSSRTRSKTPQIRKLKTTKSHEHIRLIICPSQQQMLERKLVEEKQRAKQHKQTSVHATKKLSKAKSAYKHLQLQLNFYENLQHQPNTPVPKSPQKGNYKTKYYQFLEKEKTQYYSTLKQHVILICREIETMKAFGEHKCKELQEEIDLMRREVRYLEVRIVEKFFFLEPFKGKTIKLSRDKLDKRSAFKNNHSERLISTYSSNSIYSAIPPLSPRSPYAHSPQIYPQTPHLHSRSPHIQPRFPRLKSRSPNIYERSPQCSAKSITSRVIRLKNINRVSDKSTNHSLTKIKQQRNEGENQCLGDKKKTRDNKENFELKKRSVEKLKMKENGVERKEIKRKEHMIKSKRKVLTNIRSQGEMRTQPSDEYCINSENEFRG